MWSRRRRTRAPAEDGNHDAQADHHFGGGHHEDEKTRAWPPMSPSMREKVTKVRLAALSMSSIT